MQAFPEPPQGPGINQPSAVSCRRMEKGRGDLIPAAQVLQEVTI